MIGFWDFKLSGAPPLLSFGVRQTDIFSNRRVMHPQVLSALIAAMAVLAGAVLGFIGATYARRTQSHLEYEKWLCARQDDIRRDIRVAIADIAGQIAALAHLVMWSSYQRLNDDVAGDAQVGARAESDLTQIDETHQLISRLVNSQFRLAALDFAAYTRVTPYVSAVINLSERLDTAFIEANTDVSRGRAALHRCNQDALEFMKRMPREIGGIIGDTSEAGSSKAISAADSGAA